MELNIIEYLASRKDEKISILCGAGLSKPIPSDIPLAGEIMQCILEEIFPVEMHNCIGKLIYGEGKNRIAIKDSIRFETLIQLLSNLENPPSFSILEFLNAYTIPNRGHMLLSGLIQTGHDIFTTNFDLLIEYACKLRKIKPEVIVYPKEYKNYINNNSDYPLFKLHGSMKVNDKDTRSSLKATISRITSSGSSQNTLDKPISDVLTNSLKKHDLLVIGYSGLDDFDIIPTLSEISACGKKLIWVKHNKECDKINLIKWDDIVNSKKDKEEYYLDEPITFIIELVSKGLRNKEDIIFVEYNTDLLITQLEHIYNIEYMVPNEKPFIIHWKDYIKKWVANKLPTQIHKLHFIGGLYFERENYSKALELYDKCRQLYISFFDSEKPLPLIQINEAKVNILLCLKEFDNAQEHLEESRKYIKKINNSKIISNYYHQCGYLNYNQGEIYFHQKDFKSAIIKYKKARYYYNKEYITSIINNDISGECAALHQLALLYTSMSSSIWLKANNQYSLAVNKKNSAELFEKTIILSVKGNVLYKAFRLFINAYKNNKITLRNTLNVVIAKNVMNISTLEKYGYLMISSYFYKICSRLSKLNGLWDLYCGAELQLASNNHLLRKYDNEINSLCHIIECMEKTGHNSYIIVLYGNIAQAYKYLRKYDVAIKALCIASRICQSTENKEDIIDSNIRDIKNKIGDNAFDEKWQTCIKQSIHELKKDVINK